MILFGLGLWYLGFHSFQFISKVERWKRDSGRYRILILDSFSDNSLIPKIESDRTN